MVSTTLLTAADLLEMPDDGVRHELIRGELTGMNPTGFHHLEIGGLLSRRMGTFAEQHGLGVVGGEAGFVFSRDPDTVLAPDIVFVRADRLPPRDERQGFLALAPDLAVEILSPSDRAIEVNEKVVIYLQAGVRLVWIIDPRRRTVTAYAADRTARVLVEGDDLDGGDVLPAFRLPLTELFV